ncbi:MAG: hypothetical protein LUG57_07845, partial [Oscillospiraceae bacterium]|nr:hypothetical protein [Oscillospiraceae bacterium]
MYYLTDYTLAEDFTVISGRTLTIPAGVTLTLGDNVTLDAEDSGAIINNGTIVVPCDSTGGVGATALSDSGTGDVVKSHTYSSIPVFSWSKDYSTATAAFTCDKGDGTVTETCEVTSQTTAAACTTAGKTVYTASVTFEGVTYTNEQTVSIPATGHSFGEWETVTSPACEDDGSERRVCTVCGCIETQGVDPTGHEWETEYTIDKAATCTTDGSQSIHCANCDAVKDSQTIPATGHSYEAEVTAATYTARGYT